MKHRFPFTAVVGQDLLKTALTACAINPSIGGLLIRGDKGTAKSTAARALVDVLPLIERTKGCLYNCLPQQFLAQCEACSEGKGELEHKSVPFVNLPLGATEDRVIGSLDFERALKEGRRAFQPGLLASAHRGILYIDEVNLLSDHLVDVLLDVAASGTNTVEREGVTFAHPSMFSLIGTMNLEEGDLRPQLLDRFGLMIEVSAPTDAETRAEVVRRRLKFEHNPAEFGEAWQSTQTDARVAIVNARKLLPHIALTDEQLLLVSSLCSGMSVKSLRADIVINKTACTLAALAGRTVVNAEDIQQAAQLALPHRCRTKPGERSNMNQEQLDKMFDELREQQQRNDSSPPQSEQLEQNESRDNQQEQTDEPGGGYQVFGASKASAVRRIATDTNKALAGGGRRSIVTDTARGAYVRAEHSPTRGALAVDATICHSVIRNQGSLLVEKEDIHTKRRVAKAANLILFVVDASGSMAAMKRMEVVKGAVLGLLEDAYQCRDIVGVIAFRGQNAELVLPPTRSTDLAHSQMESLPTGGTTPLAHALDLAYRTVKSAKADTGRPLLVVLTDGKVNVPLSTGTDAWQDTLEIADRLALQNVASLVVDTETGFVRLGRARALSDALNGEYISLQDLTSDNLKLTVRNSLSRRGS